MLKFLTLITFLVEINSLLADIGLKRYINNKVTSFKENQGFLNINNNKFDTIASVKNDKKHEKKDNTCFEWNNDDTTSSKTIKFQSIAPISLLATATATGSLGFLSKLFKSYNTALGTYPLTTKMISTGNVM